MSDENMADNKPVDVTKAWQANQGQKSSAKRLRIFAVLSWIVAIGGEAAGIYLLREHKFDNGNLPLLIGILVGIAVFAIAGSMMLMPGLGKVPQAQKLDVDDAGNVIGMEY